MWYGNEDMNFGAVLVILVCIITLILTPVIKLLLKLLRIKYSQKETPGGIAMTLAIGYAIYLFIERHYL